MKRGFNHEDALYMVLVSGLLILYLVVAILIKIS